jgi:hypothetical protein
MAHPFKVQYLWVKKETSLGATEFMLRLMAWLCLRNYDYRDAADVFSWTLSPNNFFTFFKYLANDVRYRQRRKTQGKKHSLG